MLAGVLIRRTIAAARATAFLTDAQMNPLPTDLDAILTFPALRMFNGGDGANVGAGHLFHISPFLSLQDLVHKRSRD
jgi:hypothetical protein